MFPRIVFPSKEYRNAFTIVDRILKTDNYFAFEKKGDIKMWARIKRCCAMFAACGFLMIGGIGHAAAQAWQPDRPIDLVPPDAAGGAFDRVARALQSVIVQDKLSNQPTTVENRPGGGGTVAISYINSHGRDGVHVTLQALPLITNNISGLSSMGLRNVTPLALLLTEPMVFVVATDSPIKNGQDLAAQLRKDPSGVSIGVSSSPGGQSQLACALVAKAIGVDPKKLKIVFFDSGSEAVTAVMGGHITVAVAATGVAQGPSEAGKIRIIATPAATRQKGALANVPTWKEQGINAEFTTWRVLVGPEHMTPAQVAWWDQLLKKAILSPAWAQTAASNLWAVDYKNSAQTRDYLNQQEAYLDPLLHELGLAKQQ